MSRPVSAVSLAIQPTRSPGRMWPHQRVRLVLNLARVHEALGEPEQALKLAEEGLLV